MGEVWETVSTNKETSSRGAVRKYGGKGEDIFNVALELDAGGITTAKQNELLKSYVKDPVNYTSCIDSAKRLFALISDDTVDVHGKGSQGDHDAFAAAVKAQSGNNAVIYAQIGASEHGFVIVVQGDRAEIFQSFAGTEGAKLVDSFMKSSEKRSFSVDQLVHALRHMSDKTTQNALFGGYVNSKEPISWQIAKLRSEDDIRSRAKNKIEEGMKALQ